MTKIFLITVLLATFLFSEDFTFKKDETFPFYDQALKEISIKDFAFMVSQNDKVNIIISDDVNASSSIYISNKPKNLMKAFRLSLSQHGYRLINKDGFFYVKHDLAASEKRYFVYQLRSKVYDDLKPILKDVEHVYIRPLNRLVFHVDADQYLYLKSFISRVDQERIIYNFKVTIFDIDDSIARSRGFDTSISTHFVSNNTSFFMDLLRVTSSKSIPFLAGENKASFYAFVDYLDRNKFAKIETSTIVNTLDQVESKVKNVQQLPVLKSQQEIVETNTKNTNSYEYQDVGLQLTLTPKFTSKDLVTLDFVFDYSLSIGAAQSEYLPTLSRKTVNNTIRLKKGQAILVGGFRRSNVFKEKGGVPVLREIPIIGEAFKNVKTTKNSVITYIVIEYMDQSEERIISSYHMAKKQNASNFKLDDEALDMF